MNIYPAIDLQAGRVVQLVGGDPSVVGVVAEHTPEAQAKAWKEAGAKRLHVVDLDAALGGERQWGLLPEIRRAGLPIQFGGGVRHMVDVQRLIEAGVNRVIIGTQGVRNPEWLREVAFLFPGKIILAVDARGRDVAIEGWKESSGHDVVELARSLDDAGLAAFLYTNVEKEGKLGGIDEGIIQDLRDAVRTELIVSGGITSAADLETLARLGVDGAVLGMSVYTGALPLQEAVAFDA